MPNSVQMLPAIETGLLGSSDHLLSPQATLPRRAAKARPSRVTVGCSPPPRKVAKARMTAGTVATKDTVYIWIKICCLTPRLGVLELLYFKFLSRILLLVLETIITKINLYVR